MSRKFSRRTFLKLSGAAAATVAAVPALPKMMSWVEGAGLEGSAEFTRSYCEMCTSRCPIQAKVVDGKTVLINGNPEWAATGGRVCARGGSGFSQLYDPQRIQKPMIRAGERGEGKWREVSWEEAYSYIAEKMANIKGQYGPEAMAFANRGGPHMAYMVTLARAYGTPNTFTHEATCPLARTVALEATFGTGALGIDYGNVKYLLSLGRNHFEGIHVAQARGVMSAMSKGAKLVSVDPRYSVTSMKAHEWYPIKPGTDLALMLAINHVLIRDKLYDEDFVNRYTEGFDALKASVAEYTPAWAEQETGIRASDIERIAKDMAAAKPKAVVDWGWRTQFTTEEFDLRRAIVITNMLLGNLEVPGGTFFVKSPGFINGLVGKEVVPDMKGWKIPAFPPSGKPRLDGAGVKGSPNFMVPPADGVVQMVPEAILTEQPYPIKGWFVLRYNPVTTIPNTQRVMDAIKKLDLLVVCDIYMTDTAWLADVVLPESTYLERDEGFNASHGAVPGFTLRQQIVKPVYDTKPHWEIFKELGEKMGLGSYFPYRSIEEIRLSQMSGRGELVKEAQEKGFLSFGFKPLFLRDKNSVASFVSKVPDALSLVNEQGIIDKPLLSLKTGSKKIELLSGQAQELFGRGVPVYRPVKLAEEGQLFFIQGKTAVHTNGHTHNVPWLFNLFPAARLWVHPATAAKLGLKDGDKVEYESSNGKYQAKVLVTAGVRPDTAFAYFGFGRTSPGLKRAYRQGVNSNVVTPMAVAPVCGTTLQTVGITLRKV
ncbi:MAG: trimethylamine-N-oxide reductase [Firmicutes bacterium]|nr:trimethylamine-N-oxide reductase [Bacillota bacterium]